ncbi:MAG: recombination protein RecR [Spirochaetales bacterium]|nr:recombination protein RecR [Spirochaetales bacterium]
MKALDDLIAQLAKLPGLGKKSATRIAYYLLRAESRYVQNLATSLVHVRDKVRPCVECGAYSEEDVCSICSDSSRDRTVLCVVEQPQDVEVIESIREYRGLYHVLMGVLSPLDGIGPSELRIGKLMERLRTLSVREVIIATNPTVEGDTTALYLVKLIEPLGIPTSRLALGLPVGGDLEYADRLTLSRSLRGRTPLTGT